MSNEKNMETAGAGAAETLREHLIPGTDDDVATQYLHLAELAREAASARLFTAPVIICDTETTGLDPKSCSLMEIAAARVENGTVVEEFQTFVDPGCPVPEEIVDLTHICDADLAGALSPKEAVAAFAEFARGYDLVAHNAPFDRSFVMKQAAPGQLEGAWVDTLPLSQIVLPRLAGHRIADISAALGLHQGTHRAIDDVRALVDIWNVLLIGIEDMEPGLASAIARISPGTDWPLRRFFEEGGAVSSGVNFSLAEVRRKRTHDHAGRERFDATDVPLRFDDNDIIEASFSAEGLAGRMYPGFEPRQAQLDMACEVQNALREDGFRVLEAGTGVGKSMAYLIPLAHAAQRNAITMGVATKTNALMDQLVYHELPRLSQAMGGLDYMALKGYDHYPCLRKMEQLGRGTAELDTASIEQVATLLSYASQTSWGDIDALNMAWKGLPREALRCNANDCLKRKCRFFPKLCYLHGARNRACSADIVVTNHALLFRDIEMDNGILPPIRHWVVDEAHATEGEARKQLSQTLSAYDLEHLIIRLSSSKSGLMAAIRRKAEKLDGGTLLMGATVDIETRCAQVTALETEFFSLVKKLGALGEAPYGNYTRVTLWLKPVRKSEEWSEAAKQGQALADRLDALIGRISKCISMTEQFENQLSSQQADLSYIACELRGMTETLQLVLAGTDDSYVYSVELDTRPDKVAEKLIATKLDIGSVLNSDFHPRMKSLIYTSATLATGGREPFGHFLSAVGLDRVDADRLKTCQLESSYDFDAHMSVLLPSKMPEPNQRDYLPALSELLYQVHMSMGGSVLTLFTNRSEMEKLYHQLRPRLQVHGIELAAQTRTASVKSLHDRFIKDKGLSLFALKSFWEGFDAPGETLRCVVIPKLPFKRPNDPIGRELEEREGRSSWFRHILPEAAIEVKQAAGRLIRKSDDEGWLILADARLRTKGYRNEFLGALPTSDIRNVDMEQINELLRTQKPGKHR